MLRKFLRMLFYVPLKERLPKIPSQYATTFDRRVDESTARAFNHVAARSPLGVQLLLKLYKTDSVDELLGKLPPRKPTSAKTRFQRWMRRLEGSTPYEPVVAPYIRQLKRQKVVKQHSSVVRRTKSPLYSS